MPLTPDGAPFEWLLLPYAEQFAKNACQITIGVSCAWDDAGSVRSHLTGYTEWDGSSAYLNRTIPYRCPVADYLFAETVEFTEFGFVTDGGDSHDPALDGWPKGQWVKGRVLFTRPPFFVAADDNPLYANFGRKESTRYVSIRTQANPRERRRPGYIMERVDDGSPIDELSFFPDVTTTIWATLHQYPLKAVPFRSIAKAGATVNDDIVNIYGPDGRVIINAAAGELLFKGCSSPLEPYGGADGGLYIDPILCFEHRTTTYGWQGYRKNDGTYTKLRVKGSGPGDGIPPYATSDFELLFTPDPIR